MLVKEARGKQMEKECKWAFLRPGSSLLKSVRYSVTCQRDALLMTGGLSEKEFNALGVILGNLDLSKSPNATI